MDSEEEASMFNNTEDSAEELLSDDDSSDSDFGIRKRKQVYFSVSHGRKKQVAVAIFVSVILLATVFCIGLIMGHFGIPYHLETPEPPPTRAPCTSSIASEICCNPPLILVSLDGFRASYFQYNKTPFMDTLAAEGVRARYMRSAYPTKTFPNHYSIVTGLYPESHGIVNNAFYDTKLRDRFHIGSTNQNDSKWWKGEPIWVTVSKSGLRSAVYFWPGSETKIQGYRPDYYYRYNSQTSFDERFNQVLAWLDQPNSTRPQFIAVYVNEPDHSGHVGGPVSPQVNSALEKVDQTLSKFFNGLEARGIKDCVNVMMVSDHGMAEYNQSLFVDISQHILSSLSADVSYPTYGTVAYLNTTDAGTLQEVFDSLAANVSNLPLRFYLTRTLPYRLHAGHYLRERYGDVQLLGDIGGYITQKSGSTPPLGEHGYDNIYDEMQAIFQAHGPAFRSNYTSEAFDNIQLYSLMCGLLGIPPAPNNGSQGSLYHLLTPSLATQLPPTQAYPLSTPSQLLPVNRCLSPTDESTFISRTFCEECVCRGGGDGVECVGVDNRTVEDANRALDIMSSEVDMYISTHLPWGVPLTVGVGFDSCLTVQKHYVSLYSNSLHLPLWTAYRLTREQVQGSVSSSPATCVRRDPRLLPNNSANCTDFTPPRSFTAEIANVNYTSTTLIPVKMAAGLSSVAIEELSTSLLSNIAPQSENFNRDVWKPLMSWLSQWVELHSTLHIIVGVVMDSDLDGFRDAEGEYRWWSDGKMGVAVPTHYYAVAVRCLNDGLEPEMCGYDELDAVGFLFQHPQAPGDPSDMVTKLRLGLTPLRDIERTAGINLFPSLTKELQNSIELRLVNHLWTES